VRNLYLKLSLQSMKKNRAMFVPYILFGAVMFALLYVVGALAQDSYVASIEGGSNLQEILILGNPIIAISSVIFIAYISSFVLKRQKKEFGLYRILGMERKHLVRVVIIENVLAAIASILIGIVIGVSLEKVAQLSLLKIMNKEADMGFEISTIQLISDILIFSVVYCIIILKNIKDIVFSSALDYMNESRTGEKRPKANWVGAILGLLFTGTGYVMSMKCENSAGALNIFFFAVILVIIGTYFLFISASVGFLQIMKSNKKYYYKINNFISISGMTYRMKRNGAGLASICILSTMVLVIMSSATTLYTSMYDVLDEQFPYDFSIALQMPADATMSGDEFVTSYMEDNGIEVGDVKSYRTTDALSLINENGYIDPIVGYDPNAYVVTIVSLDDYNMFNDSSIELGDNQVGLYSLDIKEDLEQVSFTGDNAFEVVNLDSDSKMIKGDTLTVCSGYVTLVFENPEDIVRVQNSILASREDGSNPFSNNYDACVFYALDSSSEPKTQRDFSDRVFNSRMANPEGYNAPCTIALAGGSQSALLFDITSRDSFEFSYLGVFDGLFFLGILLCTAFIVITVLIMYFKQLLEGYEDAGNYLIMRKVGLDVKTIKKNVFTQIVTVFFLPLIVAGIHNAFAYPMISNLLKTFLCYYFSYGISDTSKFFYVLVASIVIFAIAYGIIFFFTGRKYYRIVRESAEGSEASL